MYRSRRDGVARRPSFGAAVAATAIVALGVVWTAGIARADDPPALGKPVAVNDTLPRVVLAGVTQTGVATTPEATAARIGFFTATPTETTLNFSIVSQTNAVPAEGLSTSTAVYMLTTDGGTYRASSMTGGSFGVSQSVDGVFNPVGTASIAVEGQVTEIDVQKGAWTAAGTTIVVVRRDLDASLNGFESATPPILLDALSATGYGGSLPLSSQGTALDADGLTNTPCAIANMPTVTLDAESSAVTFTFATPPAANVRGTIGGVSLADLVNPPYISGGFGDATWAGTRESKPIGDFTVTASGNTVTVQTSNDQGSVFASNHQSLTIGISDPSGCYSLSPAVPFTLLLAPKGATVATVTTAATAPTLPSTESSDVESTGTTEPTSLTSLTSAVTTTIAAAPAPVTFDNSDTKTPWTAIVIVGVLAVLVGIGGGILLSRRDQRKSAARDALFTPRSRAQRDGDQARAAASTDADDADDPDDPDDADAPDDSETADDDPGDEDETDDEDARHRTGAASEDDER